MVKQHSLMMFEESVKSPISCKKYIYLVKLFMKYHKIKNFDDVVKINRDELQGLVETYVIHLKKAISPNTVPAYLLPISTFFIGSDNENNEEDCEKVGEWTQEICSWIQQSETLIVWMMIFMRNTLI